VPRKARIDAPGALHHIIVRRIERKTIFKDRHDRENFFERLGTILTESSTARYAWVLLTKSPYANEISVYHYRPPAGLGRLYLRMVTT
jgi:hypothetical protein